MSTEEQYLKGQVVLVGFGSIGSRIATAMQTSKVPFVVAEQNRELVEELREQGIAAVSGDATEPETLVQAHIANAGALIIAIPDAISAPQIVKTARLLNGKLEIMIRSTHQEKDFLRQRRTGKRHDSAYLKPLR